MKYVTIGARLLLGLIFTVFGLNIFLQFMPMPPMPDAVTKFMGGLMVAPYFFPLLGTCQVLSGVLLLANKFVPLALLILAPIVTNIVLFHLFLTPGIENLVVPALVVVCGLITAKANGAKFAPLFS